MPTTCSFQISFGDCDPAGIVFYPNNFRWMDATFHNYLRGFGGHEKICSSLQSVGLGLVDASAQFRRPMRNGDLLNIKLSVKSWGAKTLTLAYDGRVDDAPVFAGTEVRCLFIQTETGMVAGDMRKLRDILEG